jgi:hypothetical protein
MLVMTNLLGVVQTHKYFWGKIIVAIMIFASSSNRVYGQSINNFFNLKDGPLSPKLWEVVLGDLDDWQVVGGQLQGQLQPPPLVSKHISAITPQAQFWPITSSYQLDFDFIPLDAADKNLGILFDYRLGSRGKLLLSYLSFHFIADHLYVELFEDNILSHQALVPYSLTIDKAHRVKLIYQKPDFKLFVDQELLFSSKDDLGFWPDFLEPGRPLFYISRGAHEQSAALFGNFNLSYLPQLTVPYFSQNDLAWAELIYDHSQDFFNPALTIASSGCALTSAVMLLNYHGYTSFPDHDSWPIELRGQALNPATLNSWLRSEADGYVGFALVNWLAISRLSALLAHTTPEINKVLEFQFANYQHAVLVEQLEESQPLIADLDGHFIVVKGLSGKLDEGSSLEYLISDPLNNNSLLNSPWQKIKSLRLFKPSQTDLSYWLLLSPEDLDFKVSLENSDQVLLPIIAQEKNLLKNNEFWHLYYWPKPNTGDYIWQFSEKDLAKLNNAQLFVYQSDARLQIFNLVDYLTRKLKLNFYKDKLSELELVGAGVFLNYHRYLLNDLLKLQHEQLILGKADAVFRYQQLIEQFLAFYQL